MTRKEFIESQGATCKNWQWSWSFINEKERVIIFGALKNSTDGKVLIFSKAWQERDGRKRNGYTQSREHIRMIEEDGYRLMTFPVKYDRERIVEFIPELTEKTLVRIGTEWCAVDAGTPAPFP